MLTSSSLYFYWFFIVSNFVLLLPLTGGVAEHPSLCGGGFLVLYWGTDWSTKHHRLQRQVGFRGAQLHLTSSNARISSVFMTSESTMIFCQDRIFPHVRGVSYLGNMYRTSTRGGGVQLGAIS